MASESDRLSILDSDYYPMTTANKLYNLISKTVTTEEALKKKTSPVIVSQSVLRSAFKFLAKYNNNNNSSNGSQGGVIMGHGKSNGYSSSSRSHRFGNSSQQQQRGSKPLKSKSCLTVYSSPYESSRNTKVSSELPSYVKKMMENDASLRRLLKTGNVTISHIPHPARDDLSSAEANNSDNNEASTKHSSYNKKAERTNSRGSSLLKMFAKKASMVESVVEKESSSSDSAINVDFKSAMARLRVQNPSRPGAKLPGKQVIIPKKVLQRKNRLSWRADGEDTRVQLSRESDFDPTKFLEVSFREEDADEQRRKYKCPHCVKKFCWSTDLKRHILTHTGERPFSCTYCSANFTRKFLMQKHIRKHHADQLQQAESPSQIVAQQTNGDLLGIDSIVPSTEPAIIKEEQPEDEELEEEYADDDQKEYDEAEDQYMESDEAQGDDWSNDNESADEKPRPIIINVFSSVSGGSSSEHKAVPLLNEGKSYTVSKGIDESLLNQIAENEKRRSQAGKFSMLVNS